MPQPKRYRRYVRPIVYSTLGLTVVLVGLLGWVYAASPAVFTDAKTADGSYRYTNRLIHQKSPYLLQHAHNPVDWYPWGKVAFAVAKKQNKPIFLSIGYATCHWCHVMERESFNNPAIAKLINANFIAIKVDRDERPDIDHTYMTFVQATTGSGGWPMTVFLTPDGKPFFGGTYFPPTTADGLPGLTTILAKIHHAWTTEHGKVVASANQISAAIDARVRANEATTQSTESIGTTVLKEAADDFSQGFDPQHGGLGTAPKFPQPSVLNFLFRDSYRTGSSNERALALHQLRAMAAGGICDQLGGGFHRYSTDDRWFLPHFEKMLYSQGQLACAYLDAYQITHDPHFAAVARDTLDYVLRDMTGHAGQFYSAQDADSAVSAAKPDTFVEGRYYVWSADEIERALGKQSSALFDAHYGVKPKGNVTDDPRGQFTGLNVLYIAQSIQATAKQFNQSMDQTAQQLVAARKTLLKIREGRPHPRLDDDTLVAWNGLMISAFARAGAILNEPRYTQAATRAAAFIEAHLYNPKTHQLMRHYRDGQAATPGFLSDYAFYTQNLLDLYESSGDIQWLKLALAIQSKQDDLFWDSTDGGYFTTDLADHYVPMRTKGDGDNAEPSGNSIAALNLLRLSEMLDDDSLGERAQKTVRAFEQSLRRSPTAWPQMLCAVERTTGKHEQIVLAGPPASSQVIALRNAVYKPFLPDKTVLYADGGVGQKFLDARLDYITGVKMQHGIATAYLCQGKTCGPPTTDPKALCTMLTYPAVRKASVIFRSHRIDYCNGNRSDRTSCHLPPVRRCHFTHRRAVLPRLRKQTASTRPPRMRLADVCDPRGGRAGAGGDVHCTAQNHCTDVGLAVGHTGGSIFSSHRPAGRWPLRQRYVAQWPIARRPNARQPNHRRQRLSSLQQSNHPNRHRQPRASASLPCPQPARHPPPLRQ